jgi:hypothetical protein
MTKYYNSQFYQEGIVFLKERGYKVKKTKEFSLSVRNGALTARVSLIPSSSAPRGFFFEQLIIDEEGRGLQDYDFKQDSFNNLSSDGQKLAASITSAFFVREQEVLETARKSYSQRADEAVSSLRSMLNSSSDLSEKLLQEVESLLKPAKQK